jgi:hypothetical protein
MSEIRKLPNQAPASPIIVTEIATVPGAFAISWHAESVGHGSLFVVRDSDGSLRVTTTDRHMAREMFDYLLGEDD